MPVEIAILSGARQGERWATDAGRIVVGDADACDIHFDGDSDPGAAGKQGLLLQRDDGWRFENQGSESCLVNQSPVPPGGDCRLRSGDVIRMSDDGPDLRFTIITAREYATRIAGQAPSHPKPPPASSPSLPRPAQSAELPGSASAADSRVPRLTGIAVAVLLLVGLVLGLGVWPGGKSAQDAVSEPPSIKPETRGEIADTGNKVAAEDETAVVDDPGEAGDDSATLAEATAPQIAEPVDQDPARQKLDTPSAAEPSGTVDAGEIQAQAADAIVYLMVEISEQKFPVCCGWAVAPNVVVSTAGTIAVLAEMQEKGQAVFAAYGDRNPSFIAVDDLIVHPLFDKEQADTPLSRAHNLGVATLKASLPKHCSLESASALQKPPTGMPLAIVAYALTTAPELTAFNVLDPPRLRSLGVRIVGLESLPGATSDLPLLRLEADAPGGMEGAPVFTAAGKVIGVLGGSAGDRHAILCDQLQPLLP
jgi:hypothetical protein